MKVSEFKCFYAKNNLIRCYIIHWQLNVTSGFSLDLPEYYKD